MTKRHEPTPDAGLTSRREMVRTAMAGTLGLSGILATGRAAEAAVARGVGEMSRQPGELLIRGGRVVNADGARDADVRIQGEQIVEVGPNLRAGAGARIIEARDRLILPGGIDPHTHIDGSFADDLDTGSQAALLGGITTVGTFAFAKPDETLATGIERLWATGRTLASADVFLHGAAWPLSGTVIEGLSAMAAAGQPSFKLFMPLPDWHAKLADVIGYLEGARRAGVISLIHCEDAALLEAAARRLTAEGRTSLAHYAESRPIVAEVAATESAISLCESTGAPIHVVHLSSGRALEACRAARRRGLPVSVETRPLYLHLTAEKLAGPDGPLYVGQPPLRQGEDREALWAGLADGSIDVLATDHAPWTRQQKMDPELSITNIRPGMSDLQFMLPLYFSEGVGKRKLGLERFVATTSTNAARIFGLYPRKGVIQPESEADLVIWDPKAKRAIRAETDRSRADYSVYEGWEVTGWPMVTIRRGEVVASNGEITAAKGSGRLVRRAAWKAT